MVLKTIYRENFLKRKACSYTSCRELGKKREEGVYEEAGEVIP